MSDAESTYQHWLRKAESDRLNIHNNLAAERVPWDTVCFHAQQVAEKMLKALLVQQGQLPLRTHDLVALLSSCTALQPELADLEADCRDLTYYAVAVRYPDDLYEPDEAEGRRMVALSERIYQRLHEAIEVEL